MPLTRAELTELKRQLIAGRVHVKDAAARARRGGVVDLAERLRDIAELLANELDFIDRLLSKQP